MYERDYATAARLHAMMDPPPHYQPFSSLAAGPSSLITLQNGRMEQTKTSETHVAARKLLARSLKGGGEGGSCFPRMTEERWINRHPRAFDQS